MTVHDPVIPTPDADLVPADDMPVWNDLVAEYAAYTETLNTEPEDIPDEEPEPEADVDDEHVLCIADVPTGTSHTGQSEHVRCDNDAEPDDDFCAQHRAEIDAAAEAEADDDSTEDTEPAEGGQP